MLFLVLRYIVKHSYGNSMRHFYPLLHIAAQNSAKLQIIKVSTKIYTLNFGTFFIIQNTFSQLFHDTYKKACFFARKLLNSLPSNCLKQMKRFFTLMVALWLYNGITHAENIIIGDKIPDMRLQAWLMDMQPESADYTCTLFYHSESQLCQQSLLRIKQIVNQYAPKINLIIITKEAYADAGVTLTGFLSDNTSVGFDERGRTFRAFGVKFIPFCVISDNKDRAVWLGNGATLTAQTIEKILTTKTK